ncbi:PHAryngeal gland Toxin-related [Caenorhabditis elegans]|uniref:PHAryngeal gland Toxin-related n=1 Tax=Caenorhabditis elegans TaxID=6239 RepID=Q22373_CAEEL|nr:PHAryngeal gland Toxin-related [Caenorhabditis elegans]CAA96678.1 PHAryngeal gland Toxin-related [Caenorhabditis elegans]|eukprot:NP_510525.1 PHAryngeal gland Toxin-related [Caenorhabditis elegans]
MTACRLVAILFLVFTVGEAAEDCVDLLSTCESLQSICIGSVLEYHFNVISDLSKQLNSSSLPALETSLPLIQSGLPLVLGSNGGDEGSAEGSAVEGSGSSSSSSVFDEQNLKNALPLLKESLPLIRESLPLIRESLPLIRQYLDPLVGKSYCQRKATCRSCKDCPKLRDSIVDFVQALCPRTCKVCTTGSDLLASSAALTAFFS